jgi:hypothetical protein
MKRLFDQYDDIEPIVRMILTYFEDAELQTLALITRSWAMRVREEKLGRRNCVTVLTWPPTAFSTESMTINSNGSEIKLPSQGHSALKTYSGGPKDTGIYVSFWPGRCKQDNTCDFEKYFKNLLYPINKSALSEYAERNPIFPMHLKPRALSLLNNFENKIYYNLQEILDEEKRFFDPNVCYKTVPHFHTQQDDVFAERNVHKESDVHLEGLDIRAINEAFLQGETALCDAKMNATFEWSLNTNCSDVVLSLLEKGKLSEQANFKRYGWKTIGALSVFSGYIWHDYFQQFDMHYSPAYLEGGFVKRYLLSSSLGSQYPILIRGFYHTVLYSVPAGLTMYNYSMFTTGKPKLPPKIRRQIAIRDAIHASLICISEVVISEFVIKALTQFGYLQPLMRSDFTFHLNRLPIFPREFLEWISIQAIIHIGLNLPNIFAKIDKYIPIYPIFFFGPPVFIFLFLNNFKYRYDTLTTPKQVQRIAAITKLQSTINKIKSQNSFTTTFKKYIPQTAKSRASCLITFGVFSYMAYRGMSQFSAPAVISGLNK